ncbi:matrix-remodeling-associated protein 7-like isoform X1 [Acanthochromis polyacanthus]|uniref:matrix-remodeling-associated protein 7-like isoform X1 n=1 Tax=Acanthochromis polyacanthus TaxID=80966 RepID=UPI000B904E0F|nr:matrix-remodeling-associated protein 7-like isoform X1 [Acanthochromis polyacanthus]
MDVTFVLSAIIFTLLAIVVATSLLNGSSPAAANARSYFGHRGDAGGLAQNGHVPDKKKKKKEQREPDDWSDISGSSHDHWDVVKSVLSDEAQPHLHAEGLAPPAEVSSSRSSLSLPGPGSRHMSFEVDSSSEASSCRGPRSFIGLSDSELLKCAFSYPQTEGATESPGINDAVDSNDSNSLKYVPGKARSHHLEMMMSKDELEEEQRVQREQLAAIFQLLKDNKETFGDVSEGDMEEQLRLYSI